MQIFNLRAFSFDSLKKIVNFEPDKELPAVSCALRVASRGRSAASFKVITI